MNLLLHSNLQAKRLGILARLDIEQWGQAEERLEPGRPKVIQGKPEV